jgi:hypothetical protein
MKVTQTQVKEKDKTVTYLLVANIVLTVISLWV